MQLLVPILWTLVLIIDVIYAVLGISPAWSFVFFPLITLVIEVWLDFLSDDDDYI